MRLATDLRVDRLSEMEVFMKSLIVIISLCVSSMAVAKGKKCDDFSKFTDVNATEMATIVKAKSATVIDVNSEESFKKSRIPGAIHFATNKTNFSGVLPKDKNAMIVAYCGGKSCTAWQKAAQAACEMGYKNIRHFSEGITGWKKIKKS